MVTANGADVVPPYQLADFVAIEIIADHISQTEKDVNVGKIVEDRGKRRKICMNIG
jgi:hypothetical protein